MVADRLIDIEIKKYNDYAVYVTSDFSEIIIERCKISKPFNCMTGDYKEERCDIDLYTDINSSVVTHIFGCHWIWNGKKCVYHRTISKKNLNRLIESTDGYYVGFFHTKKKTKSEIIKHRRKYIDSLKSKIRSVVKLSQVVHVFKEAYAKHKQNKDI